MITPPTEDERMSIDWFTFSAQIINFLVLVALLKRFLYGPVTEAMDRREAEFASRLRAADDARANAEEQAGVFQKKSEELEHTREQLLAAAGREVDEWRSKHTQNARADVDAAKQEWLHALAREKQTFVQDLRRRTIDHANRVARTILQQLSSSSLQERIIEVFLDQLQNMDSVTREEMHRAMGLSGEQLRVLSAFELTDEQRHQIATVVSQQIGPSIKPEFDIQEKLICGIELVMGGYKVSWSIAESLELLESEFQTRLSLLLPDVDAAQTEKAQA